MKSAFAVSYTTSDPLLAANELATDIKKNLTFAKNSCAILFAEVVFDLKQLLPALEQKLGIPIIGGTSAAQISDQGYHRLSATLLVLTADDCNFGLAMSAPLNEHSDLPVIQAYEQALANLNGQEPKFILALAGPKRNMLDDELIEALNKAANLYMSQ